MTDTLKKPCSRCGETLPASRFYPRNDRISGLSSRCKDCIRDGRREISYYQKPEVRAAHAVKSRSFKKTERGRAAERKHARAFRERYPEKQAAHRAVAIAIEEGVLIRPDSCQECGEAGRPFADGRASIQAHHRNGYANALDVVWLCVDCHIAEHRALIPAQPKEDA